MSEQRLPPSGEHDNLQTPRVGLQPIENRFGHIGREVLDTPVDEVLQELLAVDTRPDYSYDWRTQNDAIVEEIDTYWPEFTKSVDTSKQSVGNVSFDSLRWVTIEQLKNAATLEKFREIVLLEKRQRELQNHYVRGLLHLVDTAQNAEHFSKIALIYGFMRSESGEDENGTLHGPGWLMNRLIERAIVLAADDQTNQDGSVDVDSAASMLVPAAETLVLVTKGEEAEDSSLSPQELTARRIAQGMRLNEGWAEKIIVARLSDQLTNRGNVGFDETDWIQEHTFFVGKRYIPNSTILWCEAVLNSQLPTGKPKIELEYDPVPQKRNQAVASVIMSALTMLGASNSRLVQLRSAIETSQAAQLRGVAAYRSIIDIANRITPGINIDRTSQNTEPLPTLNIQSRADVHEAFLRILLDSNPEWYQIATESSINENHFLRAASIYLGSIIQIDREKNLANAGLTPAELTTVFIDRGMSDEFIARRLNQLRQRQHKL